MPPALRRFRLAWHGGRAELQGRAQHHITEDGQSRADGLEGTDADRRPLGHHRARAVFDLLASRDAAGEGASKRSERAPRSERAGEAASECSNTTRAEWSGRRSGRVMERAVKRGGGAKSPRSGDRRAPKLVEAPGVAKTQQGFHDFASTRAFLVNLLIRDTFDAAARFLRRPLTTPEIHRIFGGIVEAPGTGTVRRFPAPPRPSRPVGRNVPGAFSRAPVSALQTNCRCAFLPAPPE